MSPTVDLRSDTVTQPTVAMRRAMAEAVVGDDVYGEDPTTRRLEERFAALVGKADALFTPSGTMANQLAVRVLTTPGTSVVAGRSQHLVAWENGASSLNSGVQFHTLDDRDGCFDATDVTAASAMGFHHQITPSMVSVEDTHMASGGRVWPLARLRAVWEAASQVGLPVHLDGARQFNAAVADAAGGGGWERSLADRAGCGTTLMCCMSKGLGAPVGSLLAGPADIIEAARSQRQRLGGNMRQSGILAAAGLVALEHHVERLADDHRRARRLADAVANRWPGSIDVAGVQTNLVVFSPPEPAGVLAALEQAGVRAGTLGPGTIRLVTHLDVDDAGIERVLTVLG